MVERRICTVHCPGWLNLWSNNIKWIKKQIWHHVTENGQNCSLYIIRFESSVDNISQIIYSLTTWTDGRILDSIINKFNQTNFVNGQSKHLFIDQLSASLSVNKMPPSRTQFSACTPIKPVIIRYFGWLLFQIQPLRAGCSLFHTMGPASVTTNKAIKNWWDFDRASSLKCGNKMPTRFNRSFYCRPHCLLNMFRAPLCPSSGAQDYYTVVAACGIWCCGFSSSWSGVELRVMCPVCRMLQHTRPATWKTTAPNTTGSNHCIILLSSWWWA